MDTRLWSGLPSGFVLSISCIGRFKISVKVFFAELRTSIVVVISSAQGNVRFPALMFVFLLIIKTPKPQDFNIDYNELHLEKSCRVLGFGLRLS